jgi:hypothetical protein
MNKHRRAITASVRIWSALAGDMSYATSLAGLTTMALQGRIEVFDQYLSVERLTQEAGCSGFQASKVRLLFSLWRKGLMDAGVPSNQSLWCVLL